MEQIDVNRTKQRDGALINCQTERLIVGIHTSVNKGLLVKYVIGQMIPAMHIRSQCSIEKSGGSSTGIRVMSIIYFYEELKIFKTAR